MFFSSFCTSGQSCCGTSEKTYNNIRADISSLLASVPKDEQAHETDAELDQLRRDIRSLDGMSGAEALLEEKRGALKELQDRRQADRSASDEPSAHSDDPFLPDDEGPAQHEQEERRRQVIEAQVESIRLIGMVIDDRNGYGVDRIRRFGVRDDMALGVKRAPTMATLDATAPSKS